MVWPAIIGAAGAIAGGLLSRQGQADAGEANADFQRELAQNGIRWRVEDAQRAGVHPLAVLSGSTSFSASNPYAVGDVWSGLQGAGQDIGRAVAATSTDEERTDKNVAAAGALALERAGLENDLLRAQIASEHARLSRAQIGPPMPGFSQNVIPGQGDTPKTVTATTRKLPEETPQPRAGVDAALNPAGTFVQTPTGYLPFPSKTFIDDVEMENPYAAQFWLRNQALPFLFGWDPAQGPPGFDKVPLRAGYHWRFHPLTGEWRPTATGDVQKWDDEPGWFSRNTTTRRFDDWGDSRPKHWFRRYNYPR